MMTGITRRREQHLSMGLWAVAMFCTISWHYVAVSAASNNSPKIAIIGGGIGGGSTAYYLHKWLPDASLTLFEQNDYIGGRLKHTLFTAGGKQAIPLNLGGDAWSDVNAYMVSLQKELKVPLDESSTGGNGLLGFFEGNGRWLQPHRDYISEGSMYLILESFKWALRSNYDHRGDDVAFGSIGEFLSAGGLNGFTSVTAYDYAKAHYWVSDRFLWQDVLPVTRVIYDQNLNLTAFAGWTSLLAGTTESFSTEGGNDVFVQTLVNASKARVMLNTKVMDVSKANNKNNPTSYLVTYAKNQNDTKKIELDSQMFDVVILAAPFEFSGIRWNKFKLPNIKPRPYVHWFVTMVQSSGLNATYFGKAKTEQVPDSILTTGNSTAPFVVVSIQAQPDPTTKIYKIFSNEDVSDRLNSIFVNVTNHVVQHWNYTFPVYKAMNDDDYQPIVLHDNLFYLNAMESVATAMECSVIAGRNIALLIKKAFRL
ncbi:Prenylcysteine oxidase-like [Balamuthia mandrillaris]